MQIGIGNKHIRFDASTIFELREIGPSALDAAADKYAKAVEPMHILKEFQEGLFDVAVVVSGSKLYEVIRLGISWWRCSCPDFEFKHNEACKHVYLAFPKVCQRCFAQPVSIKGRPCDGCVRAARNEAMDTAPYLPPTVTRAPESIGGIRI